MRLLVLMNSRVWGGAEVFLWRLCRELASCGVPIVVVGPRDQARFDSFRELPLAGCYRDSLGTPVGRIRGLGTLTLLLAPNEARISSLLERMKWEHGCDTVLTQDPREQILVAAVAKIAGYRAVWVIHQRLYYPLHRLVIVPQLRRAMREIERAFVISEATRRALVDRGFPEKKMRTLRVGVDLPPTGLAPDQPASGVVGVVTRLESNKGVQDLIKAAPLVLLEFPQAKFLIAGDGPYRSDLEALARKLGVRQAVSFLGWVEKPFEVYKQFSVLAYPTFNPGESMPTSILEASAAGLPVVASRWNGIPEIVHDGETGLLVPPRDVLSLAAALKGLLRNPDRAAQLGAAGHRFVVGNHRMSHVSQDFLETLGEPAVV
jgi:phosphatidyl-myo-inositol dimannoside synthase